MTTVRIEDQGDLRRVILDRPSVRNAFDEALVAELEAAFTRVTARTVLLQGAGPVFCAGADIDAMRRAIDKSHDDNRRDAERLAAMMRAVDGCPCPVIGLVQGAAMGGGVGLVAACDIVLAETDARFAFSEARLGIAPAVISPFVLRKIGVSAARRYFLTGESFPAEEARRIGLVHEVVAVGALEARALELHERIRACGPEAVRACKELIAAVAPASLDAALAHATTLIAALRISPEGQEGLRAFLEKRPARWPGEAPEEPGA